MRCSKAWPATLAADPGVDLRSRHLWLFSKYNDDNSVNAFQIVKELGSSRIRVLFAEWFDMSIPSRCIEASM